MKHGPNRRQQPSQKPSESVAAQPLLDSSTPVRTPLKHKRTYRRPQPETVKQLRPRQPKQAPRRGKATGLSSLKAYRFCYYTGIQVMRMGKRYLRRLRALRDELKARRTQHANDRSHRMQRRWGRILRSFTTPFRETLLRYRTLVARFREGHNDRQPGFAVSAWFALASCKPLATLVASYLLPFVTLVVLLVSVHHYTAMTLGLSVNYEGQSLGIIQSEAVFSEAQKAIQERIITAEADSQSTITPT